MAGMNYADRPIVTTPTFTFSVCTTSPGFYLIFDRQRGAVCEVRADGTPTVEERRIVNDAVARGLIDHYHDAVQYGAPREEG